MAQPARAGVDENDDLPFLKAHGLGGLGVVDALDVLDFEKVISAAERSELRPSALLGASGNRRRVGVR